MSDRDLKNWDQRLGEQVRKHYVNYVRRRIYLDTARDRGLYNISGEFIYIEKVSSVSANASVRLDNNQNDDLQLVVGTKLETVFREFYISNDAQADEWIDLLIGQNFRYESPFSIETQKEVHPVIRAFHANPNTNVVVAAFACSEALIKADVNNADTAWINFGAAAQVDIDMPLDPGEWIRVDLKNTNLINVIFEVGGNQIFIAYEL